MFIWAKNIFFTSFSYKIQWMNDIKWHIKFHGNEKSNSNEH